MTPHTYNPMTYRTVIDLDQQTECACNDCKKIFTIKESVVFWTWREEERTCFTFCSVAHLFSCIVPADGVMH